MGRPQPTTLYGNTIVDIGHSFSERNNPASPNGAGTHGYLYHANILLGQRLKVLNYAGVGGETSAQILARLYTDAISYRPQFISVICIANDTGNGVSSSTTIANCQAICNRILDAGITPIFLTECPASAWASTSSMVSHLFTCNDAMRAYAQSTRGIVLVDAFRAMIDANQSVGSLTPIRSPDFTEGDGQHPTVLGALAIGRAFRDAVQYLIPPAADGFGYANADPNNLITNGCFTGTGGSVFNAGGTVNNSSGIANSWKVSMSTGGTCTATHPTRTDTPSLHGFAQQVSISGSGVAQVFWDGVTTGFSAGQTVTGRIWFETDNDWTSPAAQYLNIQCRDSGGNTVLDQATYGATTGLGNGLKYDRGCFVTSMVIPASTAKIQLYGKHQAAAGTIRWMNAELKVA